MGCYNVVPKTDGWVMCISVCGRSDKICNLHLHGTNQMSSIRCILITAIFGNFCTKREELGQVKCLTS